jgi:hypothetical protein
LSAAISGLVPELQPWATLWLQVARQYDPNAQITSTLRSYWDQLLLWSQFKAGLSRYPAAPPGQSKHEQGLAFDLYSSNDQLLAALGSAWERYGGTWGGRFGDPIHFET